MLHSHTNVDSLTQKIYVKEIISSTHSFALNLFCLRLFSRCLYSFPSLSHSHLCVMRASLHQHTANKNLKKCLCANTIRYNVFTVKIPPFFAEFSRASILLFVVIAAAGGGAALLAQNEEQSVNDLSLFIVFRRSFSQFVSVWLLPFRYFLSFFFSLLVFL